jgi:hypothetical protein
MPPYAPLADLIWVDDVKFQRSHYTSMGVFNLKSLPLAQKLTM